MDQEGGMSEDREALRKRVEQAMGTIMARYEHLTEDPTHTDDVRALAEMSKLLAYNLSLFMSHQISSITKAFVNVLFMAYNLGYHRALQTQDVAMFEATLRQCATGEDGHERQDP